MTDLIILVIAAVVLAVTMAWSRSIELSLGLCYYVDENGERVDDAEPKNGVLLSADTDAPRLDVHFADIGQGDCCIIEFPDGTNMIIDAGSGTSASSATINKTLDFISDTLGNGFKYFDYAVLTHPDSDHCNVLDDVLNKYPSRVCYRPNINGSYNGYTDPGIDGLTADAYTKSNATYKKVIAAMYEPTAEHDFTPVVYVTDPADDSQTISGGAGDEAYSLTFYSPLSNNYGTAKNPDNNNYSPVMVLEYKGFKFTMTGDAEEENLGEFVAKVNAAKSDGVTDKYDAFTDGYCANVIKAGHHGSENATTTEFLEVMTSPVAVANTYSVISCGAGNTYGHPHGAALDRIKGIGIKEENILRTDEKGNISFSVRMDEEGNYNLFYGDVKTPDNPDTPDPDPDPGDPDGEKKLTLVYVEIVGIKITWAVAAWTVYAAFAVVLLLITCLYQFGITGKGGRGGGHRRDNRSSGWSVTVGDKTTGGKKTTGKGGKRR